MQETSILFDTITVLADDGPVKPKTCVSVFYNMIVLWAFVGLNYGSRGTS
jgi:hypothetical protein